MRGTKQDFSSTTWDINICYFLKFESLKYISNIRDKIFHVQVEFPVLLLAFPHNQGTPDSHHIPSAHSFILTQSQPEIPSRKGNSHFPIFSQPTLPLPHPKTPDNDSGGRKDKNPGILVLPTFLWITQGKFKVWECKEEV